MTLRRCTGCGGIKDKRELVRITRTSDGEFFVDDTGRKNGRGAYVCRNAACVKKAAKSGLAKSFRCEIPKEITDELLSLCPREDENG